MRDHMLGLVFGSATDAVFPPPEQGLEAGWQEFDRFKRGKTAGLMLADIGLIFPKASDEVRPGSPRSSTVIKRYTLRCML